MFTGVLINILVFLLPTQLGVHFWPEFARAAGVKIDYLSPTLYFVDLLLLVLILVSLPRILSLIRRHRLPFTLLLAFIFLNTVFSLSPLNTFFWWFRFFLYLLSFLSFRLQKISWRQIEKPLIYSTVCLITIQVLQTLAQSSLGGVLYFFGERAFSISTPGIARLNLFGFDFVRAPSLFSHPNSLAGYLLVVYFLVSLKSSRPWYKLIPFLGIILTLSKSALFVLLMLLVGFSGNTLLYFSFMISFIEPFIFTQKIAWSSFSDRAFFFTYLKDIITKHPFWGVGFGNFIPALSRALPGSFLTPSKLQPIHNLYYLAFSEIGLFGLVTIFYLSVKNKLYTYLANQDVRKLVSIVLLVGCFDHYFYTLPQNRLIFLLALSILL